MVENVFVSCETMATKKSIGVLSAQDCGWQRGHQYVRRASGPCARRAMRVPHSRHGSPARPYTHRLSAGSLRRVVLRMPTYVTMAPVADAPTLAASRLRAVPTMSATWASVNAATSVNGFTRHRNRTSDL